MQPTPETDLPQSILLLVKRLGDCWDRYRSELKRTRSEFAEEYVHDLRVAIRRLIAVMDMGRAITHKKKLKKSRRLLKSHLNAFDKLRDTQVQLVIAEEMQAELPEISIYRDRLREYEKQQVTRLQKKIKEFSSAGLSHQVTQLEKALLTKNTAEAQTTIWAAVDAAYVRVVQAQHAVEADDASTIHRVRLSFKKFRYRVETIHPLLTGAPEDLRRRLHDYQAAMGEIQDAEVGLHMLDDFIVHSGADIPAVRAKFVEMHQARIAAFIEQLDTLKDFWRPAPDQPFPWEN
jgi:CHAD domain-containing protein